MNPFLTAQLAEMAKGMTTAQRQRFMTEAQHRIEASGVPVSAETIDGAMSILGMVGSGRLSVPGLSAQLIHTLRYGDPSKVTNAIARELSPEGRAHRSAQVAKVVEATAPAREVGATKLTAALNKAGESVAGKSDLGDKARERTAYAARFAAALGSQVKTSAAQALERTAEQRAAAQASARAAVHTASEAVSSANSASSSLRQQVGTTLPATRQVSGMLGKAGRTVGSAGAVVDLAGVILDAMDDVLRDDSARTPTPRPDRPEDI